MRLQMVGVLTMLAVVGCGGRGAKEAGPSESAEPVAVRYAPIADTVLARPILAAGTVGPKDQIALSFKSGGVIARIAVDDGDVVKAGQTLATLDLREIEASLTRARSAAEEAERDLRRAQRLYADSVVTLAQKEDAETAAELTRADLQAAAFNRRYGVIVAPSSGIVLRRSAEPGETVAPGATVLVLGSQDRGNVVEVALPDRDVVLVRHGDPALTRFDALPEEVFRGRVTQIAAAADPATGTYAVEIALQNGNGLAAGLVGQVEIQPGRGAPATLVPVEAILEADGAQATVFTLSPDRRRAERRRVAVAFIAGQRVAVTRGLEGASSVVTDGAAYLDENTAVRVTP